MDKIEVRSNSADMRIRANVLAPVADALAVSGRSIQALFDRHSIDSWTIHNTYQEIPLRNYIAFFEDAAELAEDTFLGLRLGARFRAESFGAMGSVFRSSTTLRDALARLTVYLGMVRPGTRAELLLSANSADWIYCLEDDTIAPRRQDIEFAISASCGFIRSFLGRQWSPLAVHFEHPCPTASSRQREFLNKVFQAPVLFNQPVNRLVIAEHDLDRTGLRDHQVSTNHVDRHFRDLVAEVAGEESTATLVRYLIARRLGHASLSIKDLGAEMGLSCRTLQRRLADEGLSVRSLIEEQRRQRAEDMLSRKSVQVSAVARSLGYSEQAVLSRAFRHWHGSTPSDFRKIDKPRGGGEN
ncbi:MAG: AraC family transcriptional regulator [Croceibacterium sp.]